MIGAGGSRHRGSDGGEADVTLNLVNLPIAQAAKIVLGDILGVDYVIDPKLDVKVTVHTARPVRKAAALELFQSALRVSGVAVVRSGGLYKVVPLDQAATAGGDVIAGPVDRTSQQIGDSTRIIQLRYVSAAEMKRVLEPMAAHGGSVRADEGRNVLTLSGGPQDLATLEDVISVFDVDTMRGMSFALVPVKSSDADALADDLRNVFGSEKEGPMSGMIRFIGNKRLSAILVVSPQPRYLARARAWIERLDARAQGTEKQLYTYRVQNRPAKELVQVLASMFGAEGAGRGANNVAPRFGAQAALASGNGSGGFAQGGGAASSTAPLGALSASGPTGGGLGGANGAGAPGGGANGANGAFGAPNNANSASDPLGSKGPQAVALGEDSRFKIAADEAKNALVIMAAPEDYKRLLHVVETLDVMPNQVFIEATIAEVSLNDELQFGVSWFLQHGSHSSAFSAQPAGTPTVINTQLGNGLLGNLGNNLLGANVGAIFPGFSYALRSGNAMVTLNALNQITTVNILSTPSLTVLDNRQATLQVGDQVPINSLQNVSALGTVVNSQTYLDTGVILAITPHISESGRLMLEIDQEVSNVSPIAPNSAGNPTIQQRKVKTQVVVSDGESLVLGGLIQDSRNKIANQVPVVGDFPIIGNAFKTKDDTIAKTELLIMITPHVLRSLTEAREIADEYKRKMLRVSTKAISRPHDIEQSTRRTLLDDTSVSPWLLDRESR
jgi:general secretion pathway protein D